MSSALEPSVASDGFLPEVGRQKSPGSPASVRSPVSMSSERGGGDSARKRGSIVDVRADFIKARKQEEPQKTFSQKEKYVNFGVKVMTSTYLSNVMAAVVLLDAYCTCTDIDARAIEQPPPLVFVILSDICLGLYTLEFALLICLRGFSILKDWMVFLDLVIVFCGYLEVLLDSVGPGDLVGNLGVLRALRLIRIVRLMRLLRRIRALRELHKLVMMMATCMKALIWSFVFCFVIMTVWAMLMVELVHPIVQDMSFEGCDSCKTAVSSVMQANLLLFKTVIAGDSWGDIAVPVILTRPDTAFIFVGSLLTLVFGVLNLIVAVVVDTFAEAREQDVLNLAEEMDQSVEDDRRNLHKLFNRIDTDGSGKLTLEELIEGARRDPELQSRLRVMDIDEVDLQQLFEMIDVHREGAVEAQEFIRPLSRWVHDSKTAPRFIKYNMVRTMQNQEELYDLSRDYFDFLAMRVDSITEALQKVAPQKVACSEQEASFEGNIEPPNASVKSPARMLEELEAPHGPPKKTPGTCEQGHLLDLHKWQDSPKGSKRPSAELQAVPHVADAMQTLERFVHKASEEAVKKTVTLIEQLLQATNLDDMLARLERPHWPRHRRRKSHDKSNEPLTEADWAMTAVTSFDRQVSPGTLGCRSRGEANPFGRQVSPGGLGSRSRGEGYLSHPRPPWKGGSQRSSVQGDRSSPKRHSQISSDSSLFAPVGSAGVM